MNITTAKPDEPYLALAYTLHHSARRIRNSSAIRTIQHEGFQEVELAPWPKRKKQCKNGQYHVSFGLEAVTFPPGLGNQGLNCVSTWSAWFQSSQAWWQTHGDTSCLEARVDGSVVRYTTMPTECDGLPRIKLDISNTETWTDVTMLAYLSTRVLPVRATNSLYPSPMPICTLDAAQCDMAWKAMFPEYEPLRYSVTLPPWFPEAKPGSSMFGCPAPASICRHSRGEIVKRHTSSLRWAYDFVHNKPCAIGIERVAIVYWAPKVISKDLCANNGQGLYITEQENNTGTPVVVTMTELTLEGRRLHRIWPAYEKYDGNENVLDKGVITGTFRFTSPTIYLAYQSAYAVDACSTYARRSGGVIPINEDVQSLYFYEPKETKSGMDWVYEQAAKISQDWQNGTLAWSSSSSGIVWAKTKPVNFLHFTEPVPAGAHYRQGADCRLWNYGDDSCPVITSGRYLPRIILPSAVTDIDPAFASCGILMSRFGVMDPAIALTVEQRSLAAATLATPSYDFHATPNPARPGRGAMHTVAQTEILINVPTAAPIANEQDVEKTSLPRSSYPTTYQIYGNMSTILNENGIPKLINEDKTIQLDDTHKSRKGLNPTPVLMQGEESESLNFLQKLNPTKVIPVHLSEDTFEVSITVGRAIVTLVNPGNNAKPYIKAQGSRFDFEESEVGIHNNVLSLSGQNLIISPLATDQVIPTAHPGSSLPVPTKTMYDMSDLTGIGVAVGSGSTIRSTKSWATGQTPDPSCLYTMLILLFVMIFS